jgi:hypothetical protein
MGQFALAARQPAADLAQRMGPAELTKHHRHKLFPAREAARVPLRPGVDHGLLKLGPRKQLEDLVEDAAESGHRG